jgi:uncharacterized protein YkwD
MILPLLLMALAAADNAAVAPTSAEPAASTAPQAVTVSAGAAPRDESERRRTRVLHQLDALRQASGAGALSPSEQLGLSASRHAAYLSDNGLRSAPSVHAETAGLPGFTGVDPFSRMRAAGYRPSYATEVVGDVGSAATDADCLAHLMNTIYHAALLLSRVTEAGVAYGDAAAAGVCTIDLGAPLGGPDTGTPASGTFVRYPWPGMAVPTGTFAVGSENPRPPPSLLPNAKVGIPILVGLRNADFVAAAPDGRVEIQSFELSDAKGLPVPAVVLADTLIAGRGLVADAGLHGVFAALVPRIPLAPGRYRVAFHATIAGTHAVAPPAWWFSVVAP